ncbi:helix-turn-helix transcriptional regulator [Psychrobacter sp. APC 3279]|uniref:helix-turn-helix domain-containing protein n=1 Tax=Psychrobacter TaxID=497 RepID=UPI001356B668|nr:MULTISPECIES: helix-turn-helix transcriptional regulator [Psychrobacter]MDN3442304.1 helix-turn-helix transcriptional regulator [Psychrobacter sp. APC 3279]MDX2372645.1 helix-turn-helix transcriptional regulator [Psychrobacter sp. PP-21]
MESIEVGKRLEAERQRLGLMAVEVYEEPTIRIAQTTYKNYETGKRDMPSSLLIKLWNIGFDVMYVLTGQRLEDIALDVRSHKDLPSYHQRLINLPDILDLESPSDRLLGAMYHAEEALVQAGANANEDYDYKILATLGLGLIDTVK